jgi:uridine kinase
MDIKVFVDTPDDIRFIVACGAILPERWSHSRFSHRTIHGTVRPMHMQFVEPSKRHAGRHHS